MTSDHMRYDHIAANGNPGMVTPALDALVGEGVSFAACNSRLPRIHPY